MPGKRDLKYYRDRASELEAEVINMQYKIRGLDRVIEGYRKQTIPTLRSRVRKLERVVANCCSLVHKHALPNKKDVADGEMATVKVIEGRGVTYTIKEEVGGRRGG